MKNFSRLALVAAISATFSVLPRPVVGQSLLQDFYNATGATQANVTEPGVYQGTNLKVITGGGFVFKAPNKTFTPIGITPPSLRMGCGGIDIFLGGFSVPSRAEFVSFLRNIGQSLPGLAFQLALQSLSPDLEKQVAEFRQMLMKISQGNIDSCEAAQWLLDNTGATEAIQSAGKSVRDYMRTSGSASDESDAKERTRSDGGNIRANCSSIERLNSDGEVYEACEINLTWSLLSTGRWTSVNSVEVRQLLMSLIGPKVFRWQGTGADSVLVPQPFEAYTIKPSEIIGRLDDAQTNLRWWVCSSTDLVYCLTPTLEAYTDASLSERVYRAATRYRNSLLTRNPALASPADLYLLGSATSIPLLRITNSVTYAQYAGIGDDIIRVYSEAVAYELTMRFLQDLLTYAQKVAHGHEFSAISTRMREEASKVALQVSELKKDVSDMNRDVQDRMMRASSMIQFVEHLDRALSSNVASNIAANLKFAQSVKH